MFSLSRFLTWCLLTCPLLATPTLGREWADASGNYSIDAELVAFDDEHVILQRNSDKELGRVLLEKLSQADRQYLATKEAALLAASKTDALQSWTTRTGLTVPGRVVDYVSRTVTLQRRRGKIYVNDRVFDNLPAIYKQIVPQVVGYYEQNQVSDEDSLRSWLVHRKGAPQSYQVDGVIFELENGDEYAVPFFVFSEEDQAILKPGWDEWLAANGQYELQQDSSFELQSTAAAYQQGGTSRQRIAELQLGLQAVDVGLTTLWEVTLYPAAGTGGRPLWVVAPGRDSRVAQQNAIANNPGYVAGPVRRISR